MTYYDELYRIRRKTDPNANDDQWTADYLGGLLAQTLSPDGEFGKVITRDADLLPASCLNFGTSSNTVGEFGFASFDYTYDEVNNVTSVNYRHRADHGKVFEYTPDATHRLIGVYDGVPDTDTTAPDLDGAHKHNGYVIDDASDRLNWIESSGDQQTTYHDHVYDYFGNDDSDPDDNPPPLSPNGEGEARMHEQWRFDHHSDGTAVPGEEFRYDDNSNRVADGDFVYIYDAFNRLIEIRADDGTTPFEPDAEWIGAVCHPLRVRGLVATPLFRLPMWSSRTLAAARFTHER